MEQETKRVQVLDRAFQLFELLCKSQNGMTIQQLCKETGMNKSTVHRLLHAMIDSDFIQRNAEAPIYYPSLRICELASCVERNFDVVSMTKGILDKLSDQTLSTAHLATWSGSDITYLYKAENSSASVHMASRIGLHCPMYCTGVGKAILATLPDYEIDALWSNITLERRTQFTITDKEKLMEQIRTIRECGYALDTEENELGICCIAVAVPTRNDRAVYAVSLSMPVSMAKEDRRLNMIGPLSDAKMEIARTLHSL